MKFLATLASLMLAAVIGLAAAAPAGAQDDARIHLLHGIPGVDVDVEVGGSVVFAGFAFGDAQDVSSFAGQTLTDVMVKVAGTDDVAIDAGDVALPAEGNYTLIAHLDAEGTPTIAVFENDTSALAAGNGRLVVRHTAAAPAVDVLAGGEVVFAAVANGAEGAADLPAGTVSASVVPAGASEPVVIGPADLPVTEGEALIVYAVGSLDDDTIDVLTESVTGLAGAPTSVDTGNSPVDDGATSWFTMAALGAVVLVAVGAGTARRFARVEA